MPPSPEKTGRMLKIPEVADRLRVNPKTVRRWIANGELSAFKLGRQWRISEQDLKRFLQMNWHG